MLTELSVRTLAYLAIAVGVGAFVFSTFFYGRAKGWLKVALSDREIREDLSELVLTLLQEDQVKDQRQRWLVNAVLDENVCKQIFRGIEKPVSRMIEHHDESTNAHGSHFKAADGFTRAFVAESIMVHDQQKVVHEAALQFYARASQIREIRVELDNIKSMMAPITEMNKKIDMLVTILDRRSEPRDDENR